MLFLKFPFYMKKKLNSTIKIALATGISIFDLLTVFVASAAWFTANRQVDQEANSFNVTNYTGIVTNISIYELKDSSTNYIFKETATVSYNVDINGKLIKETTNTDPFTMGQYDQLDKPYNSVLYIITLDSDIARQQKKISFTANTTGLKDKSPLNQGNLKERDNSLSSIVQFHKMISQESDVVSSEKKFDFSNTTLSNPYKFYTLKTADVTTSYIDTYQNSFSFINIENLDTNSSDNMYIEFICDYDTEAIEDIYNLNVGNAILDTEDTIKFKQDWSMNIK